MTDGGWWMVDGGWAQKRSFNFAETLHTESTPKKYIFDIWNFVRKFFMIFDQFTKDFHLIKPFGKKYSTRAFGNKYLAFSISSSGVPGSPPACCADGGWWMGPKKVL